MAFEFGELEKRKSTYSKNSDEKFSYGENDYAKTTPPVDITDYSRLAPKRMEIPYLPGKNRYSGKVRSLDLRQNHRYN